MFGRSISLHLASRGGKQVGASDLKRLESLEPFIPVFGFVEIYRPAFCGSTSAPAPLALLLPGFERYV
jgi:hypothetical protein